MNGNEQKCHPFLRVLAGVLFGIMLLACAEAIWEIRGNISRGHPYGFLAGAIFSLVLFGWITFTGRLPGWLTRKG